MYTSVLLFLVLLFINLSALINDVPIVVPKSLSYIVAGCNGSKKCPSIAKSETARITTDHAIDLKYNNALSWYSSKF